MRPTTIRRRVGVGVLLLLLVTGVGTAFSIVTTRQASTTAVEAGDLAEQGYRLARVAGLVREFYMHQAHLALGLHAEHHAHLARAARTQLGAAIDAVQGCSFVDLAALQGDLHVLDRLFEEEFLPALAARDTTRAAAIHHRAVAQVDALVARLEAGHRAAWEAIGASRARSTRAADESAVISAGALLVTGLLALLVVGGLDRAITGPMRRLTAAAASLGDADTREVPIEGPAEVQALGRTLNTMLGALETQRQARSAAETMAALGRASAGIAHEINNPLGVILGHARLIERAGGAVADDARVIASEARLCQQIVQALLDYARPGELTRGPVDLVALLEPLCERHGARLEVAGPVTVPADRPRLGQLFANLLQNARDFGEAVSVRVTADANGVAVEVEDDGPGVDAADLDRVFEPFHTGRPEGVGLGLAIARSIAVAHAGTVTAYPGPGGRFRVWLPLHGDA